MSDYSQRSADIGSVPEARRAGTMEATTTVTTMIVTAATMLRGSAALTPCNRLDTWRVTARAMGTPIAIPPATSRRPSLITMAITPRPVAPSATLTPISRVPASLRTRGFRRHPLLPARGQEGKSHRQFHDQSVQSERIVQLILERVDVQDR